MPLPEAISAELPEEIRSNESLQSFNDVGSLAKSYIETKQMVGSSMRLPAKDSPPDQIEKWREETGGKLKAYGYTVSKLSDQAPENIDGYDFKVEGIDGEKLKADPIIQGFREFAHSKGMSNAAANEALNWYAKTAVPKMQEAAKANEVTMIEDDAAVNKILSERFGGELKQRQEGSAKAIQVLTAKIPDLKDFLEGTAPNGSGWMANKNHPAMVQLLSEVARMQQQDFGGADVGLTDGDSLDSVDRQIAETRHNKDGHPSDEVGKRLTALYKKKAVLLKMNGQAA